MTTKPPSSVKNAPEDTLERVAYTCAAGLPTVDPHDQDRLGYNLWRWLSNRRDPLDIAVKSAGVRFLIGEEEALKKIRESLQQQGVEI